MNIIPITREANRGTVSGTTTSYVWPTVTQIAAAAASVVAVGLLLLIIRLLHTRNSSLRRVRNAIEELQLAYASNPIIAVSEYCSQEIQKYWSNHYKETPVEKALVWDEDQFRAFFQDKQNIKLALKVLGNLITNAGDRRLTWWRPLREACYQRDAIWLANLLMVTCIMRREAFAMRGTQDDGLQNLGPDFYLAFAQHLQNSDSVESALQAFCQAARIYYKEVVIQKRALHTRNSSLRRVRNAFEELQLAYASNPIIAVSECCSQEIQKYWSNHYKETPVEKALVWDEDQFRAFFQDEKNSELALKALVDLITNVGDRRLTWWRPLREACYQRDAIWLTNLLITTCTMRRDVFAMRGTQDDGLQNLGPDFYLAFAQHLQNSDSVESALQAFCQAARIYYKEVVIQKRALHTWNSSLRRVRNAFEELQSAYASNPIIAVSEYCSQEIQQYWSNHYKETPVEKALVWEEDQFRAFFQNKKNIELAMEVLGVLVTHVGDRRLTWWRPLREACYQRNATWLTNLLIMTFTMRRKTFAMRGTEQDDGLQNLRPDFYLAFAQHLQNSDSVESALQAFCQAARIYYQETVNQNRASRGTRSQG